LHKGATIIEPIQRLIVFLVKSRGSFENDSSLSVSDLREAVEPVTCSSTHRDALRLTADLMVVPIDSPEDDIARLDTVGRIFGIGLTLFNADDPSSRRSRSACLPRNASLDLEY
jgi:hypothetical protein